MPSRRASRDLPPQACQFLQASGVIPHPAEFDRDVAALDMAGFLQSGDEARRERCLFGRLWTGTGIQSKNRDKVCVLQKKQGGSFGQEFGV